MTLPRDPRIYQIFAVGTLLGLGIFLRDFSLRPEQAFLTFAAGLLTQRTCARALGLPRVGLLSAIVTCIGLSVLLRADSLWVHPLAATLAIGAKFMLRVRGKHLFNPANLGVIGAISLLPGAWISPGQWGDDVVLAGWFVVLGCLVVTRSRRLDTSWIFLACYLGLLGARVLWLGQPAAVWWHQVHNGALLLFAFFMISDPMTSPNHRTARILHVAAVAVVAYVWQFVLFRPNGLVWALFLCVPIVPTLDLLFAAPAFAWIHSPGTAAQGGSKQ